MTLKLLGTLIIWGL